MLEVLARLLFVPRGTSPTARLLTVGVLAWLVGDSAYAVPSVSADYLAGDALGLSSLPG